MVMLSPQVRRVPQSQPESSMEARLLAEHLAKLRPEEVLEYAEMQRLTGLDIQRKRRDLLGTALRIVLRDHQKTFGPVTNVGMKCLTSPGIVAVGEATRQRMARTARRTVQKLACAQPVDLSQEEQYRLLAYTSIFGAMAALSHAHTIRRAVTLQGGTPAPIDPAHYRHLFVGV